MRDLDVGDDGEPEVDRPCGGGVLLIGQQLIAILGWLVIGSQREDEREDALFVVHQDLAGCVHVSRFHTPERHRCACGEVERENGGRRVLAVRNEERVPSHLDSLFRQLLGHRASVGARRHEDEDAPLLERTGEFYGLFVGGEGPHTGGEAGHPSVDQFDTLCAERGVAGESEPWSLGLLPPHVLEYFNDLFGEEGCDPCIKRVSEIRQPHAALRNRGKQLFGALKSLLCTGQGCDLQAGEGQREREIVGCIGELDLLVRAECFDSFLELYSGLLHVRVGSADRRCGDYSRHTHTSSGASTNRRYSYVNGDAA